MRIIKKYLNKKLGYMERKASDNEINKLMEDFREDALEIYMSNNIL